MDKIDYVPLGSVIYLNGGSKKLLVVARAINVQNGGKQYYFDYGGVLYPEGITGDKMAYFNHSDISRVVFSGYNDDENQVMSDNINRYLEQHPDVLRGNVQSWKA